MYRQRTTGLVKHLDFILLDLIVLQLSFVLAYCLRQGWSSPYLREGYRNMALLLAVADFTVILFTEPFAGVLNRGYWKEFRVCLVNAIYLTAISIIYLFAIQASLEYSRIICFLTGFLYLLFSYAVRLLWKCLLAKEGNLRSKDAMLVAADIVDLPQVMAQLKKNNIGLPAIQGIIALDCTADAPKFYHGIPVVATQDNMLEYVCRNWVDELLVYQNRKLNHVEEEDLHHKLDCIATSGVAVHKIIHTSAPCCGFQQVVETVGGYPVITNVVKSVTFRQAFCKRAMDIVGGLVGCCLAGVALLIVAPMIHAQSPGPIIFKQKRVGRNGKIFTMYKIRSMNLDAEAEKAALMAQNRVSDGMMFKLDFDPRIIGAKQTPDGTIKKGIGNYIRDWSIDELPQFLNVLKGDMSLVGTRPPTLDEWEKYELYHRARMSFRPGITGMWQVSGRSEITDFDEVVKLDMEYINRWSPSLDFQILLQTIKSVLHKDGAM